MVREMTAAPPAAERSQRVADAVTLWIVFAIGSAVIIVLIANILGQRRRLRSARRAAPDVDSRVDPWSESGQRMDIADVPPEAREPGRGGP